jgi:large subunit ribosomal protein L9
MEVILIRDVERVGKAGAILKVKDGFARNFLIPKGLAVFSTPVNLEKLEQEKQRKVAKLEKGKKEAEELKEKLSGLSLTLTALTKEEDKLYGSITNIDVAGALKEEGFDIDKNSIILDEPIKSLGIYELVIKLHPEVETKIKAWVVRK